MVNRLLFLVLLASTAPAFAQVPSDAPVAAPAPAAEAAHARARGLFERGVEMVRQERWPEAEAAFREASEIVARPSVLYNLALALFELGRHGESLAVLADLMAASDPEKDAAHRANATALRERALAQLAIVELRFEPADAEIRIDGRLHDGEQAHRTFQLGRGRHAIEIRADGYAPQRVEFELDAGDRQEHTIALTRLPPPRPTAVPALDATAMAGDEALITRRDVEPPVAVEESHAWPALAWGLIGTGSTLLVGALITGIFAKEADDEFVGACGGNTECDPSLKPKRDEAKRLGLASDVLLATGVAATLSGVAVGILVDEDDDPAGVALHVRWRH